MPLIQCLIDVSQNDFSKKLESVIMPRTKLGKWSVGLAVAFFFLLATGIFVILRQGPRADETFFDNPVASIPMLGAGAAGITAFLTGIISIIKHKERSVLVFVVTAIGLLVLWFVLGEILYPH